MYGPTAQCNSKTYQMFQLSATVPNLCPQPKSSLVNRLINDCLHAGCLTNRHSDVTSTHPHLARNFNEPAPITLLRFCNLCTKLWKVGKSQVWRYNWSPASRKKSARWLCVHGALAHCTFHTQAGSPSLTI